MIHKYQIGNTVQLIPLNDDEQQYNINFKVESEGRSPFHFSIIDKEFLESNNDIKFKLVEDGYISGNINSDNGYLSTYLIALKADMPLNVDVTIESKSMNKKDIESYNDKTMYGSIVPKPYLLCIVIVVILIILLVIYLFFFRRGSKVVDYRKLYMN